MHADLYIKFQRAMSWRNFVGVEVCRAVPTNYSWRTQNTSYECNAVLFACDACYMLQTEVS